MDDGVGPRVRDDDLIVHVPIAQGVRDRIVVEFSALQCNPKDRRHEVSSRGFCNGPMCESKHHHGA